MLTAAHSELKGESYGVELLHTIGFIYTSKAKAHLASAQTFLGVGGWLHSVQGKYHVFSETVGTVRAAIELKAVFDQIAKAERDGALAPEEKARLETQAAEKGIQALFKVRDARGAWAWVRADAHGRARSSRSTRSSARCAT
jgi:hypothetical protein